jgi:hypothetical protein
MLTFYNTPVLFSQKAAKNCRFFGKTPQVEACPAESP